MSVHWTISTVSHGHGARMLPMLLNLHRHLAGTPYRVILTLNIAEETSFLDSLPDDMPLQIRRNRTPQGFAANHNAALADCTEGLILVADPSLQLPDNIFPPLAAHLARPDSGIASPQAYTPDGDAEDNGRPLFTPGRLLMRYLMGRRRSIRRIARLPNERIDWLAGLFLAMRAETFHALRGFDAGYFLYCEDVDLCLRARQMGLSVDLLSELRIVHPASRDTLKKWRHLLWHLQSLLRMWRSAPYRQALRQG